MCCLQKPIETHIIYFHVGLNESVEGINFVILTTHSFFFQVLWDFNNYSVEQTESLYWQQSLFDETVDVLYATCDEWM